MNSKRVLIVTLQDNGNMGNRLQNYALQEFLIKCGYDVSSLDVMSYVKPGLYNGLKYRIKLILAHAGIRRFKHVLTGKLMEEGGAVFTESHIRNMIHISRGELKKKDWHEYDLVIAGSDQVWHNWGKIPDELGYYYLDFVPEPKRVSYAASFGFSKFPETDIEQHRKGLSSMRAISCREQEACKLINDLTGIEAVKVLDPTMLMGREFWEGVQKTPECKVEGKYLLMHFLGNVSSEQSDEIDRIAKQRGLKIIKINDIYDRERFINSPEEFLYMISHADTVCTDSFHACVFTILFNRNLRAYQRTDTYVDVKQMFGRITELLDSLGLKGNACGSGDDLSTDLSEAALDYLENERRRSEEFIGNLI